MMQIKVFAFLVLILKIYDCRESNSAQFNHANEYITPLFNLTWQQVNNDQIEFFLSSQTLFSDNIYASIGFSYDQKMVCSLKILKITI